MSIAESELHELELVMERHKAVREISHQYGLFSSLCIPRLLATIRKMQRELEQLTKERDGARASAAQPGWLTGSSPLSGGEK